VKRSLFFQSLIETGMDMAGEMEIICIGNELLIGKTVNTNAQWIAKQTTAFGASVKRVTVVADEVSEIAESVREALKRKPKFVITTGGLGPTFDDKTLEGVAEALNRRLLVNSDALAMVEEKYKAYAKEKRTDPVELTQARVKMATLPENAEPVLNPIGTAPGIRVNVNQTVLISLPGVPSEMKAIFNGCVVPLIKEASGGSSFYEDSVFVEGVMESGLAPLIDRVMRDNAGVYVKSHPKGKESMPHIEVHFSVVADDGSAAVERLRRAVLQLSDFVGDVGGSVARV
jgi:nicotinamide-nucleotide amidase